MSDLDTLLAGQLPRPFGHRAHLVVAAAAVRRFGAAEAELVLRGALRAAARHAGVGEMYHDTITRFWCRLVAHAAGVSGAWELDELVEAVPQLTDAKAPWHHWSAERLASCSARASWVDPDLQPLPFGAP
ncbi:MAG: hypothetical protein KTR31_18950 [Myxococcales bacterium]|nr:hypothetical protein [Myxococcales bacterium]